MTIENMPNIKKTENGLTVLGVGIGKGIAHGKLCFRKKHTENKTADGKSKLTPGQEAARFSSALEKAKKESRELERRAAATAGESAAEIFEIHSMMLDDEELSTAVKSRILSGDTAESAIRAAGEQLASVFEQMDDEYLRARAYDMRDIAGRLESKLSDASASDAQSAVPVIIVAADLTPSETVTLDTSSVLGFVTFGGSKNSHTAILARQMDIPALVMTGELPCELDGHDAIIDAEKGLLYLDPGLEELELFADRMRRESDDKKRRSMLARLPAVTLSGRKVDIFANIGDPVEAKKALSAGAEGIGLFRSEFLFLGRKTPPDEDEQIAAYRSVLEAMGDRRVVVRTLDVGADKLPEFLSEAAAEPAEENPALGVRGIRFCFEHTELFRTQLRALCRASVYGKLSIMLPMVVSADEVKKARDILREVQNELRFEEYPFDPEIQLGIMIETPASAIMCKELAACSDFFSVGTNDLCQYTLAADRQNSKLGELIENNLEPVFRLIEMAAAAIHSEKGKKWIGVCGELAAEREYTSRFLAAGVDELSIASPCIPSIKEEVRSTV